MSSHREAPAIAKDPVADSTDVYAFVSPDKPDTVTLIANYIPLQLPDGGPNFYEFGTDVTYDININNDGSGDANITYRFTFTTTTLDPDTFLYNTGPITSLTDSTYNRQQSYTLERIDSAGEGTTTMLGTFPCPPCNIGPLSTPDWADLGYEAIKTFSAGGYSGTVYAGQRAEGFYVDLGAIFDLGTLRPFQTLHEGIKGTGLAKMAAAVNATQYLNVHTLAVQVPITELTSTGTAPTAVTADGAVIGVWTAASRPASRVYAPPTAQNMGEYTTVGALEQVSRLANPLVNEVLIPLGQKDFWNASVPSGDKQFVDYFSAPGLAALLPDLYPGVFPNLAKYNAGTVDRMDIVAILLTGIPSGLIKGFTNELASSGVNADLLRLNVAIKPAKTPNYFGILGGDLAGFPNGRRVFDDVTSIELKALAGATLPLVDKSYKADAAAGILQQGLVNSAGTTLMAKERYISSFPYLGRPYGGSYEAAITQTPA
jgi:hypothetical protein